MKITTASLLRSAAVVAASVMLVIAGTSAAIAAGPPSSPRIEQIAKDAYIYGFPIVDAYKTLYKQAVDKGGPDFKAPFNQIGNVRNVATPAFKSIITPNSDTPYSYIWMDLRAEPVVITMPKIEKGRYYSAQLVDLYTYNFAYLGTRVYGNDGGDFLIAGPDWKGVTPNGIKATIRSDTQFAMSQFRTQLFNADDIGNVHKIQDGYKVQTLSAYLKQPARPAAPSVLPTNNRIVRKWYYYRDNNELVELSVLHHRRR